MLQRVADRPAALVPAGRRCPGALLSALALLVDAAAIGGAAALAAALAPAGAAAAGPALQLAVLGGTVLLAARCGLAAPAAVLAPAQAAPALPVAFAAVLLVIEAAEVLGLGGPGGAPVQALAGAALLAGGRLALAPLAARLAGGGVHALAVYGEAGACRRFLARLDAAPRGLAAVGALHLVPGGGAPGGAPLGRLLGSVRSGTIDAVVLALPAGREDELLRAWRRLAEMSVPVYLAADCGAPRIALRPAGGAMARLPLLQLCQPPLAGWRSAVKRLEDLVLGAALLCLCALPMAVIALAIRLDSPGPALFRQRRLGFNGRAFTIWKFRTMTGAACRADGPLRQAAPGDPRVTRVGRWLRRTSLDELPQLFNVLGGSMSLVGPRPHAACHDAEFSRLIRGYRARHRVRPGITGWAQVHGLRGMTADPALMERRVRLDLDYLEHWSLALDLRILALTVPAVLGGRNAY